MWNFYNRSEKEVELRIEGDIIADNDAWLYEYFGDSHATPNKFREELKSYSGKNLTVWINSFGGDVFAGFGIYNALKEHKGRVVAKIDGYAMSIASVIAMAAAEVMVSPVSMMMIHNPWGGTQGESEDMRKYADILDEIKESIINAYSLKLDKPRDYISKLMDAETWMSAEKAVEEGFADYILYQDDTKEDKKANTKEDIKASIHRNMRESLVCFNKYVAKNLEVPKPSGLLGLYTEKIKNNLRRYNEYE